MTTSALLDAPRSHESPAETLDQAILTHLDEQAMIGLDALIVVMPDYSWSQLFSAVDRLARRGQLTLRRHRCEYTLFSAHFAA